MFDTSKLNNIRTTVAPRCEPSAEELYSAAARFGARNDDFAQGKNDVCIDLAEKLKRYGGYVSAKQQEFARKLVEWSRPREQQAAGLQVPKLFAVLQKHTHFYADPLKLSRRNQDSLCWILWADACIGKIENGLAVVWARKAAAAGCTADRVNAVLREFEANPLGTAQKYGKESGRCCSCGRDLTDPDSIAAGIGPICATKFKGF